NRPHPQGHEQRGDERRDLRADVHGPRFLTEDPPRFSSGTSRIGLPRIGLFKGTVTALTVDPRPSRPPCLRTLASPAPVANFLKVLAVADDVFAMLDQLVAQGLLDVAGLRLQLRQPVDGIGDQVKA